MADKRITQLNEVTRVTGSDVFALVNEAETRKITYANLTSSLNSDIIAANTGSFFISASYGNSFISFGKGDGTSFELSEPLLSREETGSFFKSASLSGEPGLESNQRELLFEIGNETTLSVSMTDFLVRGQSGSFMITASMDYASGSIDFTKGDGSTFELILPQGQGAPAANSYLIATVVSGSANQEIALTGSIYENTSMIQLHYDGANGTCILWLPDASTPTNKDRSIRFISNGSVSANDKFAITGSNNQTIDGSISPYFIDRSYEGIMLWSDGTEWFRIQSKA